MAKRGRVRNRRTKPLRSKRTISFSYISPYSLGNALGILSVIALLFYAVMVWFGSYNANFIIQQYPISFKFNTVSLLIGLIQTYVLSYIGGWILAKIYNSSLRR